MAMHDLTSRFMHDLAKIYLKYSLDESTADNAKVMLLLARRLTELSAKNNRLERLAKRAEEMTGDRGILTGVSRGDRPPGWGPNFQTGSAKYFRDVANTLAYYEASGLLEHGAKGVFALEARNRLYRERLDSIGLDHPDSPDWQTWRMDYTTEIEKQSECECCGIPDCCICRICREHLKLSEALCRDDHANGHGHNGM